jgi:hypothetical protein
MHHVHPEDFGAPDDADTAVTIRLAFPIAGRWFFHASYVLHSARSLRAYSGHFVQAVQVGNAGGKANYPLAALSLGKSPGTEAYTTVTMLAHSVQGMHAAAQRVNLETGASMLAAAQASGRGKTVWRGQCTRLEIDFADHSGQAVTDLVPWLGASAHLLIAEVAAAARRGSVPALAPTHAIPAELDELIFGGGKQGGLDPCAMDVHTMGSAGDAEQRSGPKLVLYHRFAEPGPHALFIQVRTRPRVQRAQHAPVHAALVHVP